ncbi:MAG: ABC transporter substrate-binding protein [Kosmotogaceae bacterium]|nr:ABC transporter substrate-binding protein [Kosmotogaceae bacterium]
MRKSLILALLIVSFAVFAFAVTEIEFWHAMGGAQGTTVNEIVASFNEANPDIVVEAIYVGNYSALQQKLLVSAESNTLPALSQAYGNWTARLIPRDAVQELNSLISDPETGLTDEEWEAIWSPFKRMVTWGDTVYALPFNKSTYVLYYNTDLFEEYGLEVPKTMDDLLFAAMMLTEDKNNDGQIDQYGFGFRTTIDHFMIFLRANGGEAIEIKPDGSVEVIINSPEAKEALQLMYDMAHTYKVALFQGGYLDAPFGDGQIAMFVETIASASYVDSGSRGKHGWAWAPVPMWEVQAPPFAGTDVVMFKGITPEQKAAAWKFMKYLISPEIQAYWSVKTGYMPVTEIALTTPQWKAYEEQNPTVLVPISQIPFGSVDPNVALWDDVRTVLGTMVGDVINQKRTVEEGLAWAEQEILLKVAEQ